MVGVINLGLKSLRFMVFDKDGIRLAHAARPVHTVLGSQIVEQDAEEWIRVAREVIVECGRSVQLRDVRHVAVTASASCLVPVDSGGVPLSKVVMVSDSRSQHMISRVEEAIEASGSPPRRVGTDLMLPKVLWFEDEFPQLNDRVRWYFSPADFLVYHLSGVVATDKHTASKFFFDPEDGSYPSWISENLGVDSSRFPPVLDVATEVGWAVGGLATQVGLDASCRVVMATYDALCAVIGSGVADTGLAGVVSGTVTSVRALVSTDSPATNEGVYSGPWLDGGYRLVGGSNNLGGGLIEWHKQAFYRDGVEQVYDVMDSDASSVRPGAGGLVFLPYLLGERAPIWDPNVRGVFFGVDRRHSRQHFTRAVFESVAFSAHDILEHVTQAGADVREIRFSGGLSRIPTVCRVLADVLQRDIRIPSEFETTCVGAFILVRWSESKDRSLRELVDGVVKVSTVVHYDPSVAGLYEGLFEMYKHVYESLRGTSDLRNELLSRFPMDFDSGPQEQENL